MSEFNNNFLARIQEGLRGDIILQKLREHHEENKEQDVAMGSDKLNPPPGDAEMLNQSTFGDEDISKVRPSKSEKHADIEMLDQSQSSPHKLMLSKSLSVS